jgi:hypothetical protein
MQNEGDVQETPPSVTPSFGIGFGVTFQVWPLNTSAIEGEELSSELPRLPTATQDTTETHETDRRYEAGPG